MTVTEDTLKTARLVTISTAAVISSVVAVVLFRRIPDARHNRRNRGRSRSRKPPLPPSHATGSAIYYAVIMTDWVFSVTGAASQSMDMVMGAGVKVRTVVGASIVSLNHVSFLVSLLWGVVLAVFVLRTHQWGHGYHMKKFPVRTIWFTIWTIGLGCGLLSTARLQSRVTGSDITDDLAKCQRYLFISFYALSVGCITTANVVLFLQRRKLSNVEEVAHHLATVTTEDSLGNSSHHAALASTKTWELEVQQALRVAHEKLMLYFVLVQVLQFPIILCYILGKDVVSYVTFEVASCFLSCVPLFTAFVFGGRHVGEARFSRDEDDLRNNQTMLQSSSNSSRHGERQRDRIGTGLLTGGSSSNGVANVLASSYRTVFGSSAASSNSAKETTKSTNVGNEVVALEELTGLSNVSFIAEGAAGSVFKAHWLGIEVAMKVIKLPNGGTVNVADAELYRTIIENSEDAFIEEAKLCSRLRHPNITLFMRAGYFEGKLGILTEYCSRGSLKDVLKRHFPLGWRRKVALALHVSKGLTYLHARNPTYIHRDLKASNILVTETWQAKLADFGISKVSNFVNRVRFSERTVSLAEQHLSMSGELTSFAGTWRWNAPEILQDPHNCRYSRATDMYSFGMVLWEIASDGAVPFSDTKFDFEVREKVLREQRPPINPGQCCPQRFAQLIAECWAQDPVHRPSAPEAAEILNTILDTMSKDSDDFATMASVSGSEYTNSIFSSVRNGGGISDLDHRPSSMLGQRITNFFRGRFSVRSSSSSGMSEEYHDHLDNEQFHKFTSPYAEPESISMLSARGNTVADLSPANVESSGVPIVGLPSDGRYGDGLVGGRLSSLDEYDFEMEGISSDGSAIYRSSSVGGAFMLPPFRSAKCINGRRGEVRPSEDPRPSEDEAEFVLSANGRIRHLQY